MIRLKVTEDNINVKLKTESPLTFKVNEGIPIYPVEYTGDYEKTPTEGEQTLATNGLMMTDDVTIHAIDSEYVGSDIPRRTELLRNGATVTAQEGYYSEDTETEIPNAEYYANVYVVPPHSEWSWELNEEYGELSAVFQGQGAIDGFIKKDGYATTEDTFNGMFYGSDTYELPSADNIGGTLYLREGALESWVNEDRGIVAFAGTGTAGSIEADNSGWVGLDQYHEVPDAQIYYDISDTCQLSTQGATTITPTTSEQVAVAKGKFTTGVVKVAPIPNNYGLITWNGSTLTVS